MSAAREVFAAGRMRAGRYVDLRVAEIPANPPGFQERVEELMRVGATFRAAMLLAREELRVHGSHP